MTTKLHLAITPDFQIVEGFLTGGNTADVSAADSLTVDVLTHQLNSRLRQHILPLLPEIIF